MSALLGYLGRGSYVSALWLLDVAFHRFTCTFIYDEMFWLGFIQTVIVLGAVSCTLQFYGAGLPVSSTSNV